MLQYMNIKSFFLFFAIALMPMTLMAQETEEIDNTMGGHDGINRLDPDFVTASICIADPTDWHDDMLGVLGHAFIRLQCPTFQLDNCFSYEGQSANDDFIGLVRGNLKMGLFVDDTKEYIKPYKKWNRTVREYSLNLPPVAELKLWEIMDKHVEEGIDLPLDLTAHGCAQTLVEYITLALDTFEIEYGEWPEEFLLTRSEMVDKELEVYPWLRLMAKALGMYGNFDRECPNPDKIIFPRQIAAIWQNAKVDGKQLLVYKGNLSTGESPVVERPWFTPTVALVILLAVIVVVVAYFVKRKRKAPKPQNKKAKK